MNTQVRSLAQQIAQRYGIPWALFDALLKQESGNYSDDVIYGRRVSSAGAKGVAQFMDATAAQYGVNPLDPASALDGAARYLLDMLKYYGGDWTKAVASYNAGPGNVDSAVQRGGANWTSALPAETQKYLSIIQPWQTAQGDSDITPPQTGTAGMQMQPLAWANTAQTQGFGPGIELDGPGYWLNPATGQVEYLEHLNKGLDLDVPAGMPIESPISGKVTIAHDDGSGWGPRVEIEGDDGLIYSFGHLLGASVSVGDVIQAGQVIAPGVDPGVAGTSTGRHLSIDVRRPDGVWVDPTPVMQVAQGGVPTFGDFMANGLDATQRAIRQGELPASTSSAAPNPLQALLDKALAVGGIWGLSDEELQQVLELAGGPTEGGGIPEGADTEGLPDGMYWDPVTGLPTKAEDAPSQRNWSRSAIERKVKDGELSGDAGALLWQIVNQDANVNPAVLQDEMDQIRQLRPQSSYSFIDSGQGVVRLNTATGEAYYIGPDGNPISVSPAIDPSGSEQGRYAIEKMGDGTVRVSDKRGGTLSDPFKLPSEAKKLTDLSPSDYKDLIKWGMPLSEAKRMFREQFGDEMTPEKLAVEIAKLEDAVQQASAPYTPGEVKALLEAGIIDQAQAEMYMEQAVTDPLLRQLAMKQLEPGAQYSPTEIRQLFEAGLIDRDQAEGFMESVYDDPLLLELAMQSLKPKPDYTPTEVQRLFQAGLMDYEEAAEVLAQNFEDPRLLELALQDIIPPEQKLAEEKARLEAEGYRVFENPDGTLKYYDANGREFNVGIRNGQVEQQAGGINFGARARAIEESAQFTSAQGPPSPAQAALNARNGRPLGPAPIRSTSEGSLTPEEAARISTMKPGDRTRALREITGRNLTLAEENAMLGSSVAGGGYDLRQARTDGDYDQQYQRNFEWFKRQGMSPEDADWRARLQVEASRMANAARPEAAPGLTSERTEELLDRGFEQNPETGAFRVNTGLDPATGETTYRDLSQSEAYLRSITTDDPTVSENITDYERNVGITQGEDGFYITLPDGTQLGPFPTIQEAEAARRNQARNLYNQRRTGNERYNPGGFWNNPRPGGQSLGQRLSQNYDPTRGGGGRQTRPEPEPIEPVIGPPPSPPGPVRYQPRVQEAPSPASQQQPQATGMAIQQPVTAGPAVSSAAPIEPLSPRPPQQTAQPLAPVRRHRKRELTEAQRIVA